MLVLSLCRQLCPDKIPVPTSNKLGDGADGEVFEVDGQPDKVIKFCVLYERGSVVPVKAYAKIAKSLDYLVHNPLHTYARVYEHAYMGEYSRITWGNIPQKYVLYYYTMEKLNKISEDEKKVFHSILSHEDRGKKKNFSTEKVREMLRGMKTALDFDEERVTFFCDNLRDSPLSHLDIHVRNIMKDSAGYFKLIDFDRLEFKHAQR